VTAFINTCELGAVTCMCHPANDEHFCFRMDLCRLTNLIS